MSRESSQPKLAHFLPKRAAISSPIAQFDWSKAVLEPIGQWPTSLKTTLNIMLNSPLSMADDAMRKFDAFFNSSTVAIARENLAGDVLEVNRAFLTLFGCTAKDLADGITTKKLTALNDSEVTDRIYEMLCSDGESGVVEKYYVRKDGVVFPAIVGVAMLPVSNDEFVAFVIDVSETERLKQLNKAKDEFAALTSQQLRAPATAVKQYLGVLLEDFAGPVSDAQRLYLVSANTVNDRQLDTINDLLKTAQIDTSAYQVALKRVDLVELTEGVMTQYQSILKTKISVLTLRLINHQLICRSTKLKWQFVLRT